MLTKRLIVLGLSTVLGVAVSALIVFLIKIAMQPNVDIAYYGYPEFALTAIFIGAAILVWIDALAGTNLLPK